MTSPKDILICHLMQPIVTSVIFMFFSPYPTTNLGYLGPFIKTVSSMIMFPSELFKIKKGREIISINWKDTSNVVFPFQGKCYYWTLLLKVERFLDYIWIFMENICPIFLVTFREGIINYQAALKYQVGILQYQCWSLF